MTQQTKRYIDLVHGAALRKPDATAVVCGEDRLTFKQVHDRVGHLGAAFRAQGLLPGDRIALRTMNWKTLSCMQPVCVPTLRWFR